MNEKQAEILRDLIALLERQGCTAVVIENFEDEDEGLAFTMAVFVPREGKK